MFWFQLNVQTCMAQAVSVPLEEAIMVRSPTGDIDILELLMAHNFNGAPLLIDNVPGKSRKIVDETSSSMSVQRKNLLWQRLISSFFSRKGKSALWKAMLKRQDFIRLFADLGSCTVSKSTMQGLEILDCTFYEDQKISLGNKLRYSIASKIKLRKRKK